MDASNAYKNIVSAIDAAYNASREAMASATDALDKSNGVADRARESRIRSEDLDGDANGEQEYITTDLHPRLDGNTAAVAAIQQLNDETTTGIDELNAGLDMLPAAGFEQEAIEAREKAMDAQMRAEAARDKIKALTQGGLDKAKELSDLIREANDGIIAAQTDGEPLFRSFM